MDIWNRAARTRSLTLKAGRSSNGPGRPRKPRFSTWARSAGGLANPNYEELVALSAAAAVTSRNRRPTGVPLAPLYENHRVPLGEEQAASLDRLSGGRLVLGRAWAGATMTSPPAG